MPRHAANQPEFKHPPKPLAQVLRRRHHRQWGIFWLSLLAVAVLCFADHAGFFLYPGNVMDRYQNRWFAVDRVIDGDTLDIRPLAGGKPVRLRLWGIDTPEIGHAYKGTTDQPWAREAMQWTSEHCTGKRVQLKLQPQRIYGTYGRLLCYVYLDDGSMLNEQLLLQGLAKVDNRFVHQFMQRFEILQQQAQFNRIGLWSGKSNKALWP